MSLEECELASENELNGVDTSNSAETLAAYLTKCRQSELLQTLISWALPRRRFNISRKEVSRCLETNDWFERLNLPSFFLSTVQHFAETDSAVAIALKALTVSRRLQADILCGRFQRGPMAALLCIGFCYVTRRTASLKDAYIRAFGHASTEKRRIRSQKIATQKLLRQSLKQHLKLKQQEQPLLGAYQQYADTLENSVQHYQSAVQTLVDD